jgi:acetyl-CoA synthetase
MLITTVVHACSAAAADRLRDCSAKALLTCSGVMRGTKTIELKKIADKALAMAEAGGHKVRMLCLVLGTAKR